MDPDDAVTEHLLRRLPRGASAAGACPDANALSAYAEGRLPAEQAFALDAHLAACDRCREEIATLAAILPEEGAVPAARGRLLAFPLRVGVAVAAAVLVALGALLWRPWAGEDPAPASEDLEARLVAEASQIPGFRPILREERRSGPSNVERGALLLGTPAGVVHDPSPTFQWEPVPGVGTLGYEVSLVAADGAIRWTRRTSAPTLVFPAEEEPLPDGSRWVWQVRANGPLGSLEARRSFTESEGTDAELVAAVLAPLPADVRHLLRAQAFARRERYAEAEEEIGRHLSAHPDDPVGRETLDWMRRRLGLPEGGGTRLLDADSVR